MEKNIKLNGLKTINTNPKSALSDRKYRFFYHYNKRNDKMTVHFRDNCYIAKEVVCKVPCETKWNKQQPKIVMQGYCAYILVGEDKIIIE